MADFTPKKEAAKAKGSLARDNSEHMSPPVIHLEQHHLEKLGIKKMPPVGSRVKISGLAHVGAVNESQDRGDGRGPHRSMTLHMHKMDMAVGNQPGEKGVDQEAESAKGAKAEMDKALKRGAGGKKATSAEGEEDGAEETPRGGGD